jgi:hypothetical protein
VGVGKHGHLALRGISWELGSAWIRGIDPRLGSGHGAALRSRHGHAEVSALSAWAEQMDMAFSKSSLRSSMPQQSWACR